MILFNKFDWYSDKKMVKFQFIHLLNLANVICKIKNQNSAIFKARVFFKPS